MQSCAWQNKIFLWKTNDKLQTNSLHKSWLVHADFGQLVYKLYNIPRQLNREILWSAYLIISHYVANNFIGNKKDNNLYNVNNKICLFIQLFLLHKWCTYLGRYQVGILGKRWLSKCSSAEKHPLMDEDSPYRIEGICHNHYSWLAGGDYSIVVKCSEPSI